MSKIGKIELKFQVIDTQDPKLIMIVDNSKWRIIEELPAYIEVTVPGSSKPITLPFEKNSLQTYTSATLGMTCVQDCEIELINLPDGVYEFCLKGGKNGERKAYKFFLKKDNIQEKLDKAWMKTGVEFNEDNEYRIRKLSYIKGLLDIASAFAREGNIGKAKEVFQLSSYKLSSYIECEDCL